MPKGTVISRRYFLFTQKYDKIKAWHPQTTAAFNMRITHSLLLVPFIFPR